MYNIDRQKILQSTEEDLNYIFDNVAKNISHLIIIHNTTVSELSDEIGINKFNFYNFLNRRHLSIKTQILIKLAAYFNVGLDVLFFENLTISSNIANYINDDTDTINTEEQGVKQVLTLPVIKNIAGIEEEIKEKEEYIQVKISSNIIDLNQLKNTFVISANTPGLAPTSLFAENDLLICKQIFNNDITTYDNSIFIFKKNNSNVYFLRKIKHDFLTGGLRLEDVDDILSYNEFNKNYTLLAQVLKVAFKTI